MSDAKRLAPAAPRNVTALPGAATEPVPRHPARGRLPQSVTPIREARNRRVRARAAETEAIALVKKAWRILGGLEATKQMLEELLDDPRFIAACEAREEQQ